MVLVCHVILEDQVIKGLKSAITLYSKAHGMSYLHIRNFTVKVALMKTFALHANAKSSYRNKQYSPYYVKLSPKFISWASRKNKMPSY